MLSLATSAVFLFITAFLVSYPGSAAAQNYSFNSVQVEGNQRIETATIVNYAGIERGKAVTGGQLNDAYQRILGSGVFQDVELIPRGSTLVIKVTEYPTINRINFEGNKRIKDDTLKGLVESSSRRVFTPEAAERDAAVIAQAYSQQGRVAATVTPRIIRRNDNRVDLIFEISEGDTIEIERVSFVGNRVYSDRRLRRVLESKQAGLLRTFIRADTFIEDRVEFDKQVLRDFYLSRGYVDFRVNSANAEFTQERDAFFLVVDVTEGQQFTFGNITTTSEMPGVDAQQFQESIRIKPGVVYSPTHVENTIARMERLAVNEGINFLRVEPRVTRNDRDLTLDVNFVLTKGPRIFVQRIDIEGNTTTLDRVIRQQFRFVEGDPFNPRAVRASAERIRALGFFSASDVQTREGSTPDQVIIDVDVIEQPTGSLNLGGSYSITDGFGIAIGLTEDNWLGRGQRMALNLSTAQQAETYTLGFTEPYLLGRDLVFDVDLGLTGTSSNFAQYDTKRTFFRPRLTFNTGEAASLQVSYNWNRSEMKARSGSDPADPLTGPVVTSEIAQGKLSASAIGLRYFFDSRKIGLDPNSGYRFEIGTEYAGLGGQNEYLKTTGKILAQRLVLSEEVTLRASFEAGSFNWLGSGSSRSLDRFVITPDVFRGFEPGGIGPRDQSARVSGGNYDDFLGGNLYAVARLEAQFPLGLPEELGLRGAAFYDVGNLWDLKNVNTTGANVVGADGSWRHVIGVSLLWTTGFGPLRFNFTKALRKEDFDKEQTFDLTLQARF